jgi:hypothetical protein
MLRYLHRTLLGLTAAGLTGSAWAFSLLGPYDTWQTAALSYNAGNVDIGGPMNIGEEYRWNIPTITYGFDKDFLDYFGQRGVDEVNKAVAILNNLPPVSKMSATLAEFPQDTRQINYRASALLLMDLKSMALGLLAEQMGLAAAERYVWTLQNRTTPPNQTNYWVIMRNFDPVTLAPTPYVNGTLYSYIIVEYANPTFSDAVERPVEPNALTQFNSVSSIADTGNGGPSSIDVGVFFTGLTRDDVGALRYALDKSNLNVENLIPGTTGGGSSAWAPGPLGAGLVDLAVRPGVDKVVFKQIKYFGVFPGHTNQYNDTYYNPTNLHKVKQKTQRVQAQPDIIFSANMTPGNDGNSGRPFLTSRSGTGAWPNNSGLQNQGGASAGPGVIQPGVVITFNTVGPFLVNIEPGAVPGEEDAINVFGGWAAFDGTTNAPVIFPIGTSIEQLEQNVLNHGF